VGFDDGLADGQAKAKAIRLGRKEGFEQVGQLLGIESDPLIDNMHGNAAVLPLNHDTQVLPLARQIPIGIHRILDQIEEHLLELCAIGKHLTVAWQAILNDDLRCTRQHSNNQAPRLLSDPCHVSHFAGCDTLSREMTDALHDAASSLSLFGNLV